MNLWTVVGSKRGCDFPRTIHLMIEVLAGSFSRGRWNSYMWLRSELSQSFVTPPRDQVVASVVETQFHQATHP